MWYGELLIDGVFRGGACDSSIPKEVIKSPWDGRVVGTAAEGTWADLDLALDAASNWKSTSRRQPCSSRTNLLTRIADAIRQNKDDLAELLYWEAGKPESFATAEVARCEITFRLAADAAGHALTPIQPNPWDDRSASYDLEICHVPHGVVLAFVPYNWPLNLLAHKLAPALAVGAPVVVKASPLCPISSMALVRLIHEVSDGENWVHIWNGSNSEAERAVRDPRVDFLSFTGSARVGWKLHGLVPRRPAILEHGGDAFVIVDRGTDLVDAAERVHRSAFGYAGQVCISAQHALVEASLLDDFLIELRRVDATRPNWLAPMINESAAVRVEELVTEALSAGAKLELGGERQRNRFSPTVLANVPCTTRVYSEEVFGPVLTCASFSSTDEVVTRILQSPNALQLGVFTHDQRLVDRLVHDVAHPGIIVNETPSFRFDHMPYGGEKLSGLGREGVFEAMRALCVTKSVVKRG